MTTPVRLSLFAALLVAVFAGAAALGGAADPSGSDAVRDHAGPADGHAGERDARSSEHGEDQDEATERAAAALPGLAVAQDGYRLALERNSYRESAIPQRLRFQILDDSGRPMRNFEIAHEKRMHFIVVRRDFEGFQHLHPRLRKDGT